MTDQELEIKKYVIDAVREKLSKLDISSEDIDEDFDLIESGIVDSLGFIDLVANVEKQFDVEVNFDEYDPEKFTRLNGFANIVAKSRSGR